MPNFLSTSDKRIYPIIFSPAIPANYQQQDVLSALFKDLQNRISCGLFFLPNWQITQEPLRGGENKGQIFTLKNMSNRETLANDLPIFTKMFNEYNFSSGGTTAYVIFTTDSHGNINALATNLDPNAFRKLMSLSLYSMAFYSQLQSTEYWLPPMNHTQNKDAFADAFKFIDGNQIKRAEVRQQYLPGLIKTMHGFATRPEALLNAMEQPDAANSINKVLKCAKEKLKSQYEDDTVLSVMAYQLTNPMSDFTKGIVAEHVVELLVKNNVFPPPNSSVEKKSVLFVGEGDGQNMESVKNSYPQFECFGLEPEASAAILANSRFRGENRIFTSTMEEFAQMLAPNQMKKFDVVIVLNYNVRSHTLAFMRALNYCVKEHGQVVIGVSFNDLAYIGSNNSVASNMRQAFLSTPVKSMEPDYHFTQRLYIVNGTSAQAYIIDENSTANQFANDTLTKIINDLNSTTKDKYFEELRERNQKALDKLSRVIGVSDTKSNNNNSSTTLRNFGK
jgi:hypothetical protein